MQLYIHECVYVLQSPLQYLETPLTNSVDPGEQSDPGPYHVHVN